MRHCHQGRTSGSTPFSNRCLDAGLYRSKPGKRSSPVPPSGRSLAVVPDREHPVRSPVSDLPGIQICSQIGSFPDRNSADGISRLSQLRFDATNRSLAGDKAFHPMSSIEEPVLPRWPCLRRRVPGIAAELVRLKVDILVTAGGASLLRRHDLKWDPKPATSPDRKSC